MQRKILGLFIVLLALVFIGCPNPITPTPKSDVVITLLAIPGITIPVRGATPVTTAIDTAQYTGTIAWSPVTSLFAASTVYTANIVLSAKAGYTLVGVEAKSFKVSGATATNSANSGVVTANFPPTSAAPVPPADPVSPMLTPGDGKIEVSWSPVTGATSYNVFYNSVFNSGSAVQFDNDIVSTSTTITGLSNSTLYYVWIKSKNSAGTSEFSLSSLTTPCTAGLPYETLGGGANANVSRFNGKSTYSIITSQPATKPESNSAPSTTSMYTLTTTAGTGTVSAQELGSNTWTVGSIAAGQCKWYFVNTTYGAAHNIYWDDIYSGSGKYTCDLTVSAYRENLSTLYFSDVDSGFTTPKVITAAATEKIFIKVEGWNATASGTFALRDAPTGIASIISPAFENRPPKTRDIMATSKSVNQTLKTTHVYDQKQTSWDQQMREIENTALASKSPELSRKEAVIDAAAPAPIIVGSLWNGVYITTTGNTINTTCRYVSAHAYIFVDNRDTSVISSYLSGYGASFDTIYNVNHTHFGTENDTDGNGKVIIVFSRELTDGLLGYFYAVDKFPKTYYSASNEGDIFYITTDTLYQGSIVNGTLAHEFQHMIYFDEHYNRGVTSTTTWLNEALSQAAEYYNNLTDNHLAWIASFLNNGYSGLSLTNWTSSNYGYGAIYIRYLIDRFGDTAIKNMVTTNLVGVAAVEAATGVDFNTIFNDFSKALVISGTGDSSEPKWNFTTLNLQTVQPYGRGGLTTSTGYTPGYTASDSVYAYQISFFSWNGFFGTMNLSGTGFTGTGFGLSQ